MQYWVYVAYDVGDLFYDDPQAERGREREGERERLRMTSATCFTTTLRQRERDNVCVRERDCV